MIAPMVYQIVSGNDDAYHRMILFFDLPTVPDAIREEFVRREGKRYIFSAPELRIILQSVRKTHRQDPRKSGIK